MAGSKGRCHITLAGAGPGVLRNKEKPKKKGANAKGKHKGLLPSIAGSAQNSAAGRRRCASCFSVQVLASGVGARGAVVVVVVTESDISVAVA